MEMQTTPVSGNTEEVFRLEHVWRKGTVWVPELRNEAKLWRGHWVINGELHSQLEDAALAAIYTRVRKTDADM